MRKKAKVGSKNTGEVRYETAAIMFLDIAGFSKLTTSQTIDFRQSVLGEINKLFKKEKLEALEVNTWGDAILVATTQVFPLARIALGIRDFFDTANLARMNLPKNLTCRIALHLQEVPLCYDPVRKKIGVIGAEVTRAARVEPVVDRGKVWATKEFAAVVVRASDQTIKTDRLGQKPLAKGYGAEQLFNVRWHKEAPAPPLPSDSKPDSQQAAVFLAHLSVPANILASVADYARRSCEQALREAEKAIESVCPQALGSVKGEITSRSKDDLMVVWKFPSGGDVKRPMGFALLVTDFASSFQARIAAKLREVPIDLQDLRKVDIDIGLAFGDAGLDGNADFVKAAIERAGYLVGVSKSPGLAADLRLAPYLFMERFCAKEGKLLHKSFASNSIPVWVTQGPIRSRISKQESLSKIERALVWLRRPYGLQSPGVYEIPLTEDDMRSVFDIRMFWEREFAKDLAGRINRKELGEAYLSPIAETIQQMSAMIGSIAAGNSAKWKELGISFHGQIAKLSHVDEGQQREEFNRLIYDFTNAVYPYAIADPEGGLGGGAQTVADEHRIIFDCICKGDLLGAAEAAELHIRNHYDRALAGVLAK